MSNREGSSDRVQVGGGDASLYGQFCPVAMAAELLATRWTMVVLGEMGWRAPRQLSRLSHSR